MDLKTLFLFRRFHIIYIPGDQISRILEKDDIFVYEVSDPEDSNQVSLNTAH